jgi:DNA-binding MarR family transcriptional regulator
VVTSAARSSLTRWSVIHATDRSVTNTPNTRRSTASGPKTAGELSGAVGLKPAATTTLIDRLTDKGYVRRVADPADRRKVLVEMTEEGMARTYEMYRPLVEEGQRSLSRFGVAELTQMRDYLVEIRELTDRHRVRLQAAAR